ncbi:AraC family transcriptional regulator [Mesorhizobium sp. BH1-1-4]|uniref:AraC family transcriptional regulator n=1 Tax=Mesorhizobium sp. BH1-1-4 TaxID=2876662 RepID=UPI001CD139E2|nr:AraC family transcriptional regulator [Mesorhizobium sp. BH1-1-4]MBZ9993128.1 AraC family transcriptional regulator [Mesorhizobium sp. BH1-1-4]
MNPTPPRGSPIRFSTDDFPQRDRVEAWRETYGRAVLRVDVQPRSGEPYRSEMNMRGLPNLGVGLGFSTAATYRRTHAFTDGDECLFLVHLNGNGAAGQRNREVLLADGDATLLSGAETGATVFPVPTRWLSIVMPYELVAPVVPDLSAVLARRIPADTEALRLLVGYLKTVLLADTALSPQVGELVSTHVYDLVAMALGATHDAHETARRRGVRAARLRSIKDDIAANLASRDLSVDMLAVRHQISQRYIRALFESEGTNFTDFVLAARLARAHRLLVADRFALRAIGAIAFEAGFADLSHFNHSFRRRYGATPSDVRAMQLGRKRTG